MQLLAENLEEVSAHVRALGWIDTEESVISLASAGEGNMNRTLRALLGRGDGETTSHDSIILKQSVPFVAKYPQIAAPENRIDVEARFYGAIADQRELSMRCPRVLGYDPANHLLCLEDLGSGCDFTDMYQLAGEGSGQSEGQREGHLTLLIAWLATLHALPITPSRLPDGLDNQPMRELNHAHIFEIPLDPDNDLTLTPGLTAIAADYAADKTLKHKARELGQLYLGQLSVASPDVLLHGDFYPGSWLADPIMGARVIDPEFAFLGPPEFDVGVLLGHLLMCGYRETDLLVFMHGYATPAGFDHGLAMAFAGIEIIRRLLGVAQLPLSADDTTRIEWLAMARTLVVTANLATT